MKSVRFLIVGLAALAILLLIAIGVAFTSGFQTWAAHKVVASRPELHASVGRVSISLGKVRLEELQLNRNGIRLRIPSLEAELSVIDAILGRLQVRNIVAKGWTAEFVEDTQQAPNKAVAARPASGTDFSLIATALAADTAQAPKTVFSGVFKLATLPVDLSIDAADLAGEVLVPEGKGQPPIRIAVTLTGGQLRAGKEGKFDVLVAAKMAADASIQVLELHGSLFLTMDTPRSFSSLGAKLEADAKGPKLLQGAKLSVAARADRAAQGENYSVQVDSVDKTLLNLQAELPEGSTKISGSWALNASDSDLTPFALGRAIPIFRANGKGRFGSDVEGSDQQLNGQLLFSVENLEAYQKELGAMGAMRLSAEFDVTRRGDTIRTTQLQADISGMRPVASVSALQGFEFDTKKRELKVADPSKDLVRIEITGLPLAWVQPYLEDTVLTGNDLNGSFALRAHAGGFALHATRPIVATDIGITKSGKALVKGLDFSLTLMADYTPQGWQAELTDFTIKQAGTALLVASARAGQLVGVGKPTVAQGRWRTDLPAILSQPAFSEHSGVLAKGRMLGDFTASFGAQKEIQTHVEVRDLSAPSLDRPRLPDLTADLRADVAADGTITLKAPIVVANTEKQRSSDLNLSGTIKPGAKALAIDARISSQLIALEDIQILAAPLAGQETPVAKPTEKPSLSPRREQTVSTVVSDAMPFWTGIEGQLTIISKKVLINEQFFVSDINGAVKIDAGSLRVDGFKAGLSPSGSLTCDATLAFLPSKEPYTFKAEMTIMDFDSKGLLASSNGVVAPSVEAKFNIASNLTGTGKTPSDLAEHITGKFNLISKGGTFRMLRSDITDLLQQKSSPLGNLVAAGLGSLLGGKNDSEDGKNSSKMDEYMRMASDIASYCAAIPFDQLSVVVTRDNQLNLRLQDFAMISPMIRLSGSGEVRHVAGTALADGPLDLRLQMGARGKLAATMDKAKLLDGRQDSLGYVGLSKPLRIGGTLANPDTSEFKAILRKVALTKATDAILDRILGGR